MGWMQKGLKQRSSERSIRPHGIRGLLFSQTQTYRFVTNSAILMIHEQSSKKKETREMVAEARFSFFQQNTLTGEM